MSRTDSRLTAALEAVSAACRVARSVQRELADADAFTKDDRSPVTVADFAAQAIVQRRLEESLGERPRIVGEESAGVLRDHTRAELLDRVLRALSTAWRGCESEQVLDAIDACDHDASGDAYWTLDPIDGTKGFLRRGQYAVSLALIEGGEVTLGVMGCPNLSADFARDFNDPDPRGLIYFAQAGSGAFETPADDPHGEPARISTADSPPSLRVRFCESVESGHTRHDDTARIIEAIGGAGDAARLDSQCKYAVVARGQADAYLRMPTRPGYVERIWDHAAGMLIAVEAGAIVTDVQGESLDFSQGTGLSRNRGVICATPAWHGRILEAIERLELAPRSA